MIFLCYPNNPTGATLGTRELQQIAAETEEVVVFRQELEIDDETGFHVSVGSPIAFAGWEISGPRRCAPGGD